MFWCLTFQEHGLKNSTSWKRSAPAMARCYCHFGKDEKNSDIVPSGHGTPQRGLPPSESSDRTSLSKAGGTIVASPRQAEMRIHPQAAFPNYVSHLKVGAKDVASPRPAQNIYLSKSGDTTS
jgi:hypothetical protein